MSSMTPSSAAVDGVPGWFEVRARTSDDALALRVHHPASVALGAIVARVKRMFDVDADPHTLRLREACAMERTTITDDDIRNARRAYYGNISYVDDWTATLMETLRSLGKADDTIVIVLADDLVDITSESMQSGKTPGTDLREGVVTLAGILALASEDPADARLRDLLSRPLPDDDEHAEALALLRAHPALEAARAQARGWSSSARDLLVDLPDGPPRDVLALLCDYVVTRTG